MATLKWTADRDGCLERSLKPELRKALQWPQNARFWPFAPDLRIAFRLVKERPKLITQSFFDSRLPFYPHEYLDILAEADSIAGSEPTEGARLRISILRYYSQGKKLAPELSKTLDWYRKQVMRDLSSKGPEEWDANFVLDAVGALEWLASGSLDPEARRELDELLLRYVRQARLNAKEPPSQTVSTSSLKIEFGSVELRGPRIIFLVDTTRPTSGAVTEYTHRQVADAIRAMSSKNHLNVCLCGDRLPRKGDVWLFDKPKEANEDVRRKAVDFIRQVRPPGDDGSGSPPSLDSRLPVEMGIALEALVQDWPKGEAGDICIVYFGEDLTFMDEAVEDVRKRGMRLHLISEAARPNLLKLVVATGGTAILLETKGARIVPKRWAREQ